MEEGILPRLAESLGLPVTAEVSEVHGLGALVLENLSVGGEKPLLTAARAEVALEAKQLLRGRIEFESIVLLQPELRLSFAPSGPRVQARTPKGRTPHAHIKCLDVRDAVLAVSDEQSRDLLRLTHVQIMGKDITLSPSAHIDGIADLHLEYPPWGLSLYSLLSFGCSAEPSTAEIPARLKARLHAKQIRCEGSPALPSLLDGIRLGPQPEIELVLAASVEAQSIRIESVQSQFRSS